jgi:hypothetical protein
MQAFHLDPFWTNILLPKSYKPIAVELRLTVPAGPAQALLGFSTCSLMISSYQAAKKVTRHLTYLLCHTN